MSAPRLGGTTFSHEGLIFRDLDHDGLLAPFEDWRLTPRERASDLVARMDLAEKVGLVLHGTLPATGPFGVVGVGDDYDEVAVTDLLQRRHVSSAISRMTLAPAAMAKRHNELQRLAAATRFSVPLSISSDPRHHFTELRGTSHLAHGFTKFPEFLGFGATNDPGLVRAFADVVRREYRAVGFHVALSPQADLATEPRWTRGLGTFGANPARVSRLVGAYVEGAQGGTYGLDGESVACVVKHWVGYGACREGLDGHNAYGRFSSFPAGRFQDHVDAFADAFAARVAGVMPTYNILEALQLFGAEVEQVGAGFSHTLLTRLLRGTHGFEGVVLSDWAITKDATEACLTGVPPQGPADIAMCWGVEHLSRPERVAMAINAGVDQIGGEDDPEPVLAALRAGLLSEARLDEAARRVLEQKFQLGLFENPFVDEAGADELVGRAEFHALSRRAQRDSLVAANDGTRSLRHDDKVYLVGVDREAGVARGLDVVDDLDEATVAVVRLSAPFEQLHPTFFFGSMMHEGSLAYADDDPRIAQLRTIAARVPVITVVFCDRPPTRGVLDELSTRLVFEYGVTDEVLLERLSEEAPLTGRAPVARPVSMDEVDAHEWDRWDGWTSD